MKYPLMTLDGHIRDMADAGNFSHLSITSSGTGFTATFSPSKTWGQGHGFHLTDPVQSAIQAIEDAPKERSRGVKAYLPVEGPLADKPVHSAGEAVEEAAGSPLQANVPVPSSLMNFFKTEN